MTDEKDSLCPKRRFWAAAADGLGTWTGWLAGAALVSVVVGGVVWFAYEHYVPEMPSMPKLCMVTGVECEGRFGRRVETWWGWRGGPDEQEHRTPTPAAAVAAPIEGVEISVDAEKLDEAEELPRQRKYWSGYATCWVRTSVDC